MNLNRHFIHAWHNTIQSQGCWKVWTDPANEQTPSLTHRWHSIRLGSYCREHFHMKRILAREALPDWWPEQVTRTCVHYSRCQAALGPSSGIFREANCWCESLISCDDWSSPQHRYPYLTQGVLLDAKTKVCHEAASDNEHIIHFHYTIIKEDGVGEFLERNYSPPLIKGFRLSEI